jgi:hypothetical protein
MIEKGGNFILEKKDVAHSTTFQNMGKIST